MKNDMIALDESMRHKDRNGHLIIKETVITKESVDPYYGRDIPNYESLGLDPDKVYYLYRPADEIERAIDTFKMKQLLMKHLKVDASDPKQEQTIGTIGSDLKMKDGKLYGDMAFWDDEAIALIETRKHEQLSGGYGYDPVVQSGDFNGTPYDIKMTNLHGNHVALVKRGRIGNDAIICDEQTVKGSDMKKLLKFKQGSMPKIAAAMQLAMDSEFTEESVNEVVKALDEAKEDEPAKDSDDLDKDPPKAKDEDKKAEDNDDGAKKDAKDEDDKATEKKSVAMDAAMIEQIESNATKKVTALFEAREAVKPLVGVVAMDSAEEVYQFALEQKGVSTKGIHPSAYQAMVGLLAKQPEKPIAMDSAPERSEFTTRFKQ